MTGWCWPPGAGRGTCPVRQGLTASSRCERSTMRNGSGGPSRPAAPVSLWWGPGSSGRRWRRRPGRRCEHWTNAVEQASAAAAGLLHQDAADPYIAVPYFWSDQYGVKIQLVGDVHPHDEVRWDDDDQVALYTRAGRLSAALGFNRM